ncbi:site-specific integrase [Nocardioides panacihumi]|uniref:Site-specific integrase n=1 Tax=Nocardioides panacihumi TaxID=400774 RepID=A0ABP5CZN9_9ACTN
MAGSMAKRPNGRWRARYRDEGNREHSRHFDRKVDAQRWLDGVTASVVTDSYVDPKAGRITFQQFYDDWSTRQVWAPGTVVAMRLAAGSTGFTDLPMKSIRRSHVEAWVKRMDTAGLAPGTIKTRVNNVRSVFKAAHRDRVIGRDPTEGVPLPRVRRTEHGMRIPSPDEVGRLLSAADPWFRPFVALCAFAGLRLGEAAGVQHGDVNFLGRQLRVMRQVQRAPGSHIDVRAPKYGSERVVFVPDGLITLLSAHVAAHPVGPEGWLFTGPTGEPPHQNTVGYWWRKTLRDADLSGIKLHDLRHFFASGLIAEGCDVVTVQRALGHSKPTTTLNTYAHLWPTAEDRTRKAAQRLMKVSVPRDLADYLRTGGP